LVKPRGYSACLAGTTPLGPPFCCPPSTQGTAAKNDRKLSSRGHKWSRGASGGSDVRSRSRPIDIQLPRAPELDPTKSCARSTGSPLQEPVTIQGGSLGDLGRTLVQVEDHEGGRSARAKALPTAVRPLQLDYRDRRLRPGPEDPVAARDEAVAVDLRFATRSASWNRWR
jgi:hypothetical protein